MCSSTSLVVISISYLCNFVIDKIYEWLFGAYCIYVYEYCTVINENENNCDFYWVYIANLLLKYIDKK